MSYVNLPPNLHACCGAYWAGQTCRRCGRHFEGGGAISVIQPANGLNLREDKQAVASADKPKKRKNGRNGASRCLNCGATLPPESTIAVSLICGKCQKEMLARGA